MTEQNMTAADLLAESLHSSGKKKDFIESLRHRRLVYLDRAAMCEELITELGEMVNDEMTTEDLDNMLERRERPRRRHREQTGSQDGEDESTNMDGSPDLRKKENLGIRAEEGQRREEEDGDTRKSRRRESDAPVKNASHKAGSSPEAEGEVTEEMITKEGEEDKRYKPNETEAEYKARHMLNVPEDETDGRGKVRDPENDLRLKKNLGKRARLARGEEDDK